MPSQSLKSKIAKDGVGTVMERWMLFYNKTKAWHSVHTLWPAETNRLMN